ncbi:TRAP transporter substrate-binding protein [Shimia abyssi]|uniref:TRAP-type C4-dicarboxylate transport system substrate-binding protein n=1 Tax=Shimia abyssi TaxID=1662395 RepID=A0A2P8FEB6_9RHOB|nr:TRAP transporter substrate-binding protein [Shimia abyssi]PSL20044.1 TRAP-type C4-dicarboxylate transport system substrate-binding protein [Shimia abyssi]
MKLVGALAASVALFIGSAASAKDLSLSYFMGPKHPMNGAVFTPFAEKLAEVSGGEMTVTQFAGGALNSAPPKQYSILLDGVADVAFHLPGYTAQLFPIATSVTTPNMCDTAVDCTEAMWRAYDVIENEFDAKILALWANSPQVLFSKDTAIRTLEDLDGKIVRVTSAQDIPFTEALGASAVSQPVSVINQNLANGVVDVVSIDPSAALSFKLHEPTNYITVGVPGAGSAFILLMNKGVYGGLSDQEKAWVDEASGKWLSMQGAKAYDAIAQKALDVSAKNGVDIINLSDEEAARWDAAIQPAMDAWMASEVGQGLTGADVTKLMQGN